MALKLAYEYNSGPFHLLANAGYSHSPDNKYSIINYRNLLLTELGLSYDLSTDWNINLELNRHFTLSTDHRQDEGDYYITMKNKTTDDLSTYFGAGIAGFSSIDRKNWTAFAGLKYNFGEEAQQTSKTISPVQEAPVKKSAPIQQVVETPVTPKPEIKSAADEKRIYGEAFASENIYFDNGKTNIKDSEQLKIDQLVTKLSKHIKSINHIVVEGYASKTGNSKNNQILSLKRAREVQAALVSSGIKEDLTSIVAYGDRALKQDSDENKNRKVQFRIYLLKARK
jgi:outer membrane protein OmpA-like peptidoglycan-associated protein